MRMKNKKIEIKPPGGKANVRKGRFGIQTHEIRIIGGLWKRTKLVVSNKPGLRPSPDRVRETLFNWLGQDLSGWRCLDAFAGTGVLGFEAASRGAQEVCIVEQDPSLIIQLHTVKDLLKADVVKIIQGNAQFLDKTISDKGWDLIFLDPPFEVLYLAALLKTSVGMLSKSGFIYLESPRKWSDVDLLEINLGIYRYMKAGAVHAHLLKNLE